MRSGNGSSSGTTTSSPMETKDGGTTPRPSRSGQIRARFLAGETLDATVADEYDLTHSMLTKIVRDMKHEGHVFSETKTSPTEPVKYRISEVPDPDGSHSPVEDPRSNYEKVSEALIAGEHLRGSDLPERGMKPQLLSMAIARLKQLGYLFDFDDTDDGKCWFVTGKGDPQPRKKRRSTGDPSSSGSRTKKTSGSRPKMPAPELDALTDIVLVHRISPDEIEVAFRQGARQWLVAVRSCIED